MFYLYLHVPTPVFKARVNQASFTYPLSTIVYDGVTLGAFGDVLDGMFFTIGSTDGADDSGRGRIQNPVTSTTIPVGRVSQGTHDGELDLADNDYITVWNDFRVHSKIPFIASDGLMYKDNDTLVGDNTDKTPPVANTGPGFAATINSGTSLITVSFDGGTSFATADGATITTFFWDVDDGTITVGTSASAAITATFPAGFRWVSLTVTDSNGKTHTARCPVYGRDPDNDTTIDHFEVVRHVVSLENGQQFNVRVLEDIPRSTYPDGCLVMFWEDEPLSPSSRLHMQFIGWHQSDTASVRATRTGNLRDTVLECVDILGRLDSLPAFDQKIDRAVAPANWAEMVNPTMDKFIHYLLHWHSTVLDLADFFPSDTGNNYPFVVFTGQGESMRQQVENEARALVPDHHFTCNRRGQLAIVADPILQDIADRTTTVQGTFTEEYTQDIRFAYTRPPRIHWIRGNALLTATGYTVVDGVDTLLTVHNIAPGTAPGQGVNELTTNEQLAISQADLNAVTGNRYARVNSRYGLVTITPPDSANYTMIDPATMDWVNFSVTATTAAQRGLTFTNVRTQCKEINVRYSDNGTGFVRTMTFTLEIETSGLPAETVVPAETVPPEDFEVDQPPVDTFVPGIIDPINYSGNMKAFVLWDGTSVVRTWDIQASSPTWALVDTGVTGTIYDGQYVHISQDVVGMWLLTSDAVWWCADIMATTPVWTSKLAIATVVAADVAPASGTVEFKAMYNYATEPGYLIVATGPVAADTSYLHAYFWHTHDYGANWTQIDMNAFTFTNLGQTRCYSQAGRFSIDIYRSSPGTIFAVRAAERAGTQGRTAVFKSTDLGHTWTKEFEVAAPTNDNDGGSILTPYPNINDPTYMSRGNSAGAQLPQLYRSTDAWATGTALTAPTGYDGMANSYRVNKRTFDNTHVISWWHNIAGNDFDLLESFDQGATWSFLLAGVSSGDFHTPNGWPGDVQQWVIVRSTGALGSTTIRLTLNNFSTMLDKQGNLSSILPGGVWVSGLGNGFALPRVSVNS